MTLSLIVSDENPSVDADIVLKIDYDEESASAAHAFELAAEIIRSLEDLDRVLTQSIDPQLTTALIVEDLEKSSLKIFLKSILEGLPDDALKDADIKKLVGHYLLKGKYAAIRWLDQKDEEPRQLSDLTEEISRLAKETDLRHLPDYPPPNPNRLAQPLDRFQETKKKFQSNEGLTITLGRDEYSVHVDRNWLPSEGIKQDEGEKELVSEQDQFLIIAKPDFIGNAKWSFRHGKKSVSYNISDEDWLTEFRLGRYPIKPGDALRVRIRVRHLYDRKGDLTESSEEIVKVFSVIEEQGNDSLLL
jgi:hypothetical protein